ncbi:CRISPR-associated protein Cas5 [Brachyspira sp.]|uniref:CRISPR-associated protein Cas5 n=1 Tax=Brachyspira sp. TaxID=1977261 RepID=UPI003D7DCA91
MMQVIKIKCFQNMVNYKRQGFNEIWQSYPLPPYSSVIGMIHKLCGFTEYKEMYISVQGESANSHYGLFTKYSFNKKESSLKSASFRGVGSVELLIDLFLIIHVYMKDIKLLKEVCDKLNKPEIYPSLGRHEDILIINSAELIEIVEAPNKIELRHNAYIPVIYLNEEDDILEAGTRYLINKKFYIDEKDGIKIRKWEKEKGKINVKYMRPRESRIKFNKGVFVEKGTNEDEGLGVFLDDKIYC